MKGMGDKKHLSDSWIIELAERLRYSAANLPDPNEMSEFDEESLPEELKPFAYAERYIRGKAKPIAVITDIETENFPPAEKLSESQTEFLFSEMMRTLHAYCFDADFPKGLPVRLKYKLLREKWNEKAVYTGEGVTCFEFCDYEPSRCPFPEEFCGCKEFDYDDEFDPEDFDNTDEMPF